MCVRLCLMSPLARLLVTIGIPASLVVSAVGISAASTAGAAIAPAARASTRSAVTATTGPQWHSAQLRAPANAGTIYAVKPLAVSCSAPGYCAAAGYLQTPPPQGSNYDYQQAPIVAVDSGGRWSRFSPLELPADAAPGNPTAQVSSVSCPTRTFCVAVGYYTTTAFNNTQVEGFTATLSAGTWSRAVALALPASLVNDAAALDSVSCPTSVYCLAAGTITTGLRTALPLTAVRSNGQWQVAEAPSMLPSTAQDQMLNMSVSCPSAGNCAAVGTAYSFDHENMSGLQWVESHGSWRRATITAVPSDADQGTGATLSSVSCSVLGSCVAVGFYDRKFNDVAMQVTRQRGRWHAGIADRIANTSTTFNAVSCTWWICVAVGNYHGEIRSLAVSERHGSRLGDPVTITLPANKIPSASTSQVTGLTAVSCLSKGWCAAVGSYINKADIPVALVAIR